MNKIFETISFHRVHSSDGLDYVEIDIMHKRKMVQRLILTTAELGRFISGEQEIEIRAEVY